jgi:rare lipoprotein A
MSTGTMPAAAIAVTLMLALPAANAVAGVSENPKPQAAQAAKQHGAAEPFLRVASLDTARPAKPQSKKPAGVQRSASPVPQAQRSAPYRARSARAAAPRPTQDPHVTRVDYSRIPPHQTGVASYYARHFNGRRMANGQTFDPHSDSIAHRSLPFGTRVRITNLSNGRSVYGTVRDRGPFTRGRMLDVSPRIAGELGMLHSGIATVSMWRAGGLPVEVAEAQ